MNVCRRISFRLYFWKWTPNFGLVSLLAIDILNKSLSSFVAYWPHAHEEYLRHGAAKYVSSWGVKNIQNWRDCSQGSADLFILISLDSHRQKWITNDTKIATVPERERTSFLPLPHPCCLSPPSRWHFKLGNSPSSHLSPAAESKWATPHLATRSQVLGGKWSPLFHSILSLPVISSYLVFKLLHAPTICYNWITDGNHFMALWLTSSAVCCFFWWSDLLLSWCLSMLQSLCKEEEAPQWRHEPCQQPALR